eukprot:15366913-Ditylum_brightwellii.AAC.1
MKNWKKDPKTWKKDGLKELTWVPQSVTANRRQSKDPCLDIMQCMKKGRNEEEICMKKGNEVEDIRPRKHHQYMHVVGTWVA